MTSEQWLERLRVRLGVKSIETARQSFEAVAGVLGERLSQHAAARLALALPEPLLGQALGSEKPGQTFSRDELFRRVAQRLGARVGIAVEHTTAVTALLAESVREPVLEQVRRDLPNDFAALLTPAPPLGDAPPHLHPERRTLAEGRPGGARPLYAASPDRAQQHSVRQENPHGDTKLSSARGLTQEREKKTLAEGAPGSERPLSG